MNENEKNAAGKEGVEGRWIDFLGYNFSKENVRLRKSIKQNFAHKVHRLKKTKNEKRKIQILGSYWDWCKWGRCRNLWNVITDHDMSFADKGIKPQSIMRDGKRLFDVPEKRIAEILNIPITIEDFEAGIKTKLGDDRYVVIFHYETEPEKGQFKFLTAAMSLKQTLDQARAAEASGRKVFPVDNVTIKQKSIGAGKKGYYFD